VTDSAHLSRRSLIWTLRIVALVVVCWGVSGSVRKGVAELAKHEWQVQPAWLFASGALYAIGLMPMAWFWHRTLIALKSPPPFAPTMRAYFLGHVAKYVPGKAMTVILRVAAVRKWVPSMRIALTSTVLETLTMMSVGALLAAVISAFVLHLEPYVSLIALAMACVAGAPTLPPIARFLARLGIARYKRQKTHDRDDEKAPISASAADISENLQGINYGLSVTGWFAATICWLFLALSLWATLRAIGVDTISPLNDLPRLIAAVAFAVVAGFLSQLPAGLGVRDALLMQLLVPVCGDANALVAAVLMRLVWLVSEVVVCGILYVGAARKQ
jgi:glycosyltransferase 2 family protein